ncbi:fumarylacetoacetate hydrolase family protein [Agrobacterium salinitolerans]|uniref:2-keto-4-pentenoate hydratase n=1 Tax=Agrobacterium salinitolerans TaxID=1183413 RepID=A0A9X3KTU5_9HYPH|nr:MULTISPECIES: fumarylacetoacetate hydrolase family protein [Agrobacterium]MCZ7854649.1 fumarylacetoacetate hydrolase family protein [Agrobacterium salinitolerans]MCZ7893950.1 fumarylacetoacetate hydrolase family protein [Agrobacterium salinitolerans]MCZ7939901.1 fumarylacetoacetate hydrolase family protein [Agrobacterium salinitolerans]TRA84247.1 2-keto-4-pentenoate hydratase [Agrobacterium salinitolerans]
MSDSYQMMDTNNLAQTLVRLRSEGKQLPTTQFQTLPADRESAMEIQGVVSELENIDSRAWKVASSPSNDHVVAPLHPFVRSSPKPTLIWRQGIKLEVEIAVKLGKNLPVLSNGAYSRSGLADAISEIYLGAELVWSAVEEGARISYPLFLADRLGNMGYVIGPRLPASTLDPFGGMPLAVSLDRATLHDGVAQHPAGDVLTWLLGYANDRSRPSASLLAGSVFTTGSLCGAIEIKKPGEIVITFGPETAFDFVLSAEP